VLFRGVEDSKSRQARDTLQFSAIDMLATAASHGADAMEALVTAKRIEDEIASGNVTVADTIQVWSSVWTAAGDAALTAAASFEKQSLPRSAASAYGRASAYLAVGERFDNHTSPQALERFNRSVTAFQAALRLRGSPCGPVRVPYTGPGAQAGAFLHAYWCCPAGAAKSPSLVLMTGYDGTAEMLVGQIGEPATSRGMCALAVEGPGQGSVARFQGLRFRPDWGAVTRQVMDWAESGLAGYDPARVALWGRSFGGHLAPKAFATIPARTAALVADGGMRDAYQTFVCQLPDSLQQLWYTDQAKFEEYMRFGATTSLSLHSIFAFGRLGFGAASFTELYTMLQDYTMSDAEMAAVAAGNVLVNDPAADTTVGNQSAIFFAALPRPLTPATMMLELPADRGAGLHCGVGSTSVASEQQLGWAQSVLESPDGVSQPTRSP